MDHNKNNSVVAEEKRQNTSSFETGIQQDLTDLLFAVLHLNGPMKYMDIFKTLTLMLEEVIECISSYSEFEISSLMVKFQHVFMIDKSECILAIESESAFDLRIDTKDGKVAAFLQILLQDCESLKCTELRNALKNFCVNMKSFLSVWPLSEQLKYFQKSPVFRVSNNGTVEAIFMYRCNVEEVHRALGSKNVKRAEEFFHKVLRESRALHYILLVDRITQHIRVFKPEVISFFKNLSTIEKHWYFKNRQEDYFMKSNGLVMLQAVVQQRVIDFFLSKLQNHVQIHYSELIQMLQNSELLISEYFSNYSKSEKIIFFRNLPTKFNVGGGLYISAAYVGPGTSAEHQRFGSLENNDMPSNIHMARNQYASLGECHVNPFYQQSPFMPVDIRMARNQCTSLGEFHVNPFYQQSPFIPVDIHMAKTQCPPMGEFRLNPFYQPSTFREEPHCNIAKPWLPPRCVRTSTEAAATLSCLKKQSHLSKRNRKRLNKQLNKQSCVNKEEEEEIVHLLRSELGSDFMYYTKLVEICMAKHEPAKSFFENRSQSSVCTFFKKHPEAFILSKKGNIRAVPKVEAEEPVGKSESSSSVVAHK